MSVISRLNKSTLSATQKRQVKKALASKSTIKYVTADDTVANASVAHVPIDNLSIPVEKNKVYKFFLGPGNNHEIIKKVLEETRGLNWIETS